LGATAHAVTTAWYRANREVVIEMRQAPVVKPGTVPRGVALNLLASALTILTAIALLGTASAVGDASFLAPVARQDNEIILDFYNAVNEVLRSGDFAALDRVVAPDAVSNTPSPRIAPNRAGLEQYLADLHENFPDFQLQVEDIVGDGDRAVARVVGGSTEPSGFLGLSFAALPRVWGQFDVFHVENSRIIEVEISPLAPVVFEPAMRIHLGIKVDPQVLSLEWLSAPSAHSGKWGPFFGSRVLYVDEGAISVEIDATSPPPLVYAERGGRAQPAGTTPGTTVTVTAGNAVFFPPGSRYTFRHDATEGEVVAFAVALPHSSYNGPLQPQTPSSNGGNAQETAGLRAVRTALVADPLPELFADATVSFGHALMAPGADITFSETEGYAFVAIESGTLVLQVEHDAPLLERVDLGAATMVMPGAPFSLHNLGNAPARVMVATVVSSNPLPESLR
jgi:predicted ester cyclase/mannose-6-phosphate isomerase-like protein (cupin superfamily)